MRRFAALLLALVLPACAHAWTHGGGIGGGPSPPPVGPCANTGWTLDNGCTASTLYVASPFYSSATVANDSAQSGQLPGGVINGTISGTTLTVNSVTNGAVAIGEVVTGAGVSANTSITAGSGSTWTVNNSQTVGPVSMTLSPSAAQIAQRNTWLHTVDYGAGTTQNYPYLDYPIGSANPATLTAISSWSGDADCVYHTTGARNGGGPYLGCVASVSTPKTITIQGYDFSNTGGGTGTGCAELEIRPSGSKGPNYTYILKNDFFQANLESTQANTNYCWKASTVPGGVSTFIYSPASATVGAGDIQVYNVTFDGNVRTAAGTLALTGADYRMNGIQDSRTGPSPFNSPIEVYYSFFYDMGHIPIFGGNAGTPSLYYNASVNTCTSGNNLCHGEFVEYTGGPNTRNDTYVGNVVLIGGVHNAKAGWTSAFYPTSGASNGISLGTLTMSGNLVVMNATNCSNSGPPDVPASPYGPTNQCVGGSTDGDGLVAFGRDDLVSQVNMTNNVVDGTATFACAINNDLWQSVTSVSASVSGGNQFQVFTAASNYSQNHESNLFPGEYLTGPGGFIPTTIASLSPSYVNASTAAASIGTLTLTNGSEPNIPQQTGWHMYAYVNSVTQSGNQSIGGAYATRLAAGPQSWSVSTPFLGALNCP